LPPDPSYVSTLPDITQNRNTASTSKSRGSLTFWTVFLRAYRRSQWQTWMHAYVKAKGRHFEHLLWFTQTTGSEPLHTHRNRFFSEPLTLPRGRQHDSSAQFHCSKITSVQDIQDYASIIFLGHSVVEILGTLVNLTMSWTTYAVFQ